MPETEDPEVIASEYVDEVVATSTPANVVLYNDDELLADTVVQALELVCQVSREKAWQLTVDAHNNGRAVVYSADLLKCLDVSDRLSAAGLTIEVETTND